MSSLSLSRLWVLRDELRVVVLVPRQQAPLTPVQEAAQGDLRVGADLYLVFVRPYIYTDKHHTHADRAVQLVKKKEKVVH